MYKAALLAVAIVAQPVADHGLPAISASAFRCMVANVYHEARGEGKAGMAAVAQVTVNRATKGKTVCSVVYAHKQFSWANTAKGRSKAMTGDIEPVLVAAYQALAGAVQDATEGATHYHATCVKPVWAKHMVKTKQIGNHIFYKVIK